MRFLSPAPSFSLSIFSCSHPPFLHEMHAVIPSRSHRHRGRERKEQNAGLAEWRRIFFFFSLMKRSLKRDIVRWNMIVYLFLLSFCCLTLMLSLPLSLLSTFPYLSFSSYSRPLESKWFQLWEEMNGCYLFLFPRSATAVSMLYVKGRGASRVSTVFSALGTWVCNPWSMQGRGGKENTETQTERCDIERLKRQARAERKCETDGARRQTDRGGKR